MPRQMSGEMSDGEDISVSSSSGSISSNNISIIQYECNYEWKIVVLVVVIIII